MAVKIQLVNRRTNRPAKFISRKHNFVFGNVLLEFDDVSEAHEFVKKVGNNIKIFLEEYLKLL